MDSKQFLILQAIEERGYLGGWTMEQFLMRQVAKLVEELGEVASECGFGISIPLMIRIQEAADQGKHEFDHGEWIKVYLEDEKLERIWMELADMQVVLACAGEAVCWMLGEKRDLMDAALEKAMRDVERGVRTGEDGK